MPAIEINDRQWEKALDICERLMRKVNGRGDSVAVLAMSLAFVGTCKNRGIDPVSQVESVLGLVGEVGE